MQENNKAVIVGKVEEGPIFSHEVYGEKFYGFLMCVPRLSDVNDYIRVLISERLMLDRELNEGDEVEVVGQFRSYNNYNGSSRLLLTVFAKDIIYSDFPDIKNPNSIYLNGYICKPPVYRTTPFGREITDMLMAVNRSYNKSDYIPVIAWGRNARYCKNLAVSDNIRIWGRIQSREYQKKLSDDETITKTAYEISVSKLEKVEEEI
ncbi:MAG: single-stranded DNA-binding protein [Oscillospiraceae bacterium]|nr:single-stranded DNA-binding protein [Oscillospiraceae bacterium]